MMRAWLGAAAVVGFASVAAGAAGAHLSPGASSTELLRTAAAYGLPHAAALVGVAALARGQAVPGRALILAGWAFAVGSVLFSLGLFALALTGIRIFGLVTPFGGVGLLIGWAALGMHALPFGLTKGRAQQQSPMAGRVRRGPG
jgi:uncharacterized membrane protein YgdD (TMEM256/DUF423 family)